MIHIVTVHFRSLDWIPIQHAYINANVSQFKIWYFIDEVEFEPWPFDFDVHYKSRSEVWNEHVGKDHAIKLDKMVNELLANEPDDDVVLFLDGDSFPIAPIDKLIDEALTDNDFFAIVREEIGQAFPHPSFACCRLGFWRKHNLSWRLCGWDTGGCLFRHFNAHNIKWKKVLRSHSLCDPEPDPEYPAVGVHLKLLFGVYGGFIYHHGAYFRYRFPLKPHSTLIFNKIKQIGTNFREIFLSPNFEPYTDRALRAAYRRKEKIPPPERLGLLQEACKNLSRNYR